MFSTRRKRKQQLLNVYHCRSPYTLLRMECRGRGSRLSSPRTLPAIPLCRASRCTSDAASVPSSASTQVLLRGAARRARCGGESPRGGMGTNGSEVNDRFASLVGVGALPRSTVCCTCVHVGGRRAPVQSLHSHVAMQSRNIRGSRLFPLLLLSRLLLLLLSLPSAE